MAATGQVPGGAFAVGQVVTIFRSRRRPEGESDYQRVAAAMQAAARDTPGFVDFKTFSADDGEKVSLVTFATPAAHQAWRDDPRHRRAQQQGRDDFYVEYSIQVGECSHVSRWAREPG
jgi:heme-degrading monooxygenase HmoA